MKIFSALFFVLVLFSVVGSFALADFTSPSFQLENPVNIIEGGESQSPSFKYFSNTGQLTGGQSTSSSFAQNAGLLYFPTATSPIVSATPGNAQVILNWSAAVGILANITSYDVGISTTPGGTFTYSSVGNVITHTRTSLLNGTTYYFKVRSYAAGILLSESAEVSAIPVAPPGGGGGGGGSGGGGGGGEAAPGVGSAGVIFSGRAYPLSKVSILKDGQLALSTIAGPDSKFTATLSNLSAGDYTFSVYGEDKNRIRSSSFTFQIYITSGVTTNIGGIFIAPTISVDKKEVKKGENIIIFGQSSPTSEIIISVNSEKEIFKSAFTDASGVYLHNFDTSVLEIGKHSAKSKASVGGEISSFSASAAFVVGLRNVEAEVAERVSKCDLNEDGRCNLIDFSIAAFWYKRPLSEAFIPKEIKYLNADGRVDLVDFSIMAFYWTG